MTKSKRLIYTAAVMMMIIAALPTVAQAEAASAGLFTRIETLIAKIWPLNEVGAAERTRPDIKPADGAVARIGVEVQPVGQAVGHEDSDRQTPDGAHSPEG